MFVYDLQIFLNVGHNLLFRSRIFYQMVSFPYLSSSHEKLFLHNRWSHSFSTVYSGSQTYNTTKKDPPENNPNFGSNSSRAELLEALRHSQTRAREAEIAAKKAYEEKEHILKLLFRQASHLFAYKQWLNILQLESLCLQLKIKDHQISNIFPILPWMPLKGRPSSRNKSNKPAKGAGKRAKKCGICRYAVVFAVGLGLAGAGLLLGWTLGWLFPSFWTPTQ